MVTGRRADPDIILAAAGWTAISSIVQKIVHKPPDNGDAAEVEWIMLDAQRTEQLLERLGQAISAGDMETIAACWTVPALVLSNDGALAVTAMGEIVDFFTRAVEGYRSQGRMSTRPELERFEPLTERMAAIDVRWPAFDAAGREQVSERSHYILHVDADGQPRVRVALTRTA